MFFPAARVQHSLCGKSCTREDEEWELEESKRETKFRMQYAIRRILNTNYSPFGPWKLGPCVKEISRATEREFGIACPALVGIHRQLGTSLHLSFIPPPPTHFPVHPRPTF